MIQTNGLALEILSLSSLILSPMGDKTFLHFPAISLILLPMGNILTISFPGPLIGPGKFEIASNIMVNGYSRNIYCNTTRAVINRIKGQKGYEKE
jgi:hypothetical protein